MAESLLTLREVTVHHGEHVALQGASLEVHKGDVLALIGPNGAGKSTLLRVMGMLQRPDHGEVLFRGQNALNGNPLELRRRIATVFRSTSRPMASEPRHRPPGRALRAHALGGRGAAHEPGAGACARTRAAPS